MSSDTEPGTAVTDAAPVDDGSMTSRVVNGAKWTTISGLGTQGLQFVTGVVLAHFLSPADFGLLVSVLVLSTFISLFFELGLAGALVQMEDLTDDDLSTVFWLNGLGGLVFAGLMALSGPLLAAFFDQPELAGLAPVVALAFTVHLGTAHQALLERKMRFRALAIVEVAAAIVGFSVSIALAVSGAGAYALALGPVASGIVVTIGFWSAISWRPKMVISRVSIAKIWKFSGGALGGNVVVYWGNTFDNLMVGRFAGPTQLGLYNRSFNFMMLPVVLIGQVLGRVMFPALAAMRGDHERSAEAYRRSIRLIAVLSIPALGGVAAVAPALVPNLWGHRWDPMVPLLITLCVAGIPLSISTSTGWIYNSQGRTDLLFKVSGVVTLVGIAAMAIGVHWGAKGVAYAVVIRSWVTFLPEMVIACRVIELKARYVLVDVLRAVAITGLMVGAVVALPYVVGLDRDSDPALFAQIALGVVVYGGASLLWQRDVLGELKVLRGGSTA